MDQNLQNIVASLREIGDKEVVAFKKKKFGIDSPTNLGISMKDLKAFAKELPKDDNLAKALYQTGIYEAKLLCGLLHNPKTPTSQELDEWVAGFDTWEICDCFSMALISYHPLAEEKIAQWVKNPDEFIRRAGFVLIACYTMRHKDAPNKAFDQFYPFIHQYIEDNRVYVKKAISWALRNIGKRNSDLKQTAIQEAQKIKTNPSTSAQWIAQDVLRELNAEKVSMRNYPKSIYRKA